ncbi:glutamate ABC transporter substrate-binding protein [Streptomyces iconiensis]|uniref:Glutamate ABC transporter substrate-binding protein n=1 Tax=Streptomyces iconiensis TaxID=1384038 RepID=A0ABT6ZQU0_9ACTN|nr:glutamate ABC transporter substrate-binding protein [Streptomyces iconiensis]MDJ1131421.1 glutamate ABC transporter substrate-binding protein [Streptomyces iconiensis]
MAASGFPRFSALVTAVCALLISGSLAGCGKEGSPPGSVTLLTEQRTAGLRYSVAPRVPVGDSGALARAKARGSIRVGVKSDHPFLGFEDPMTGRRGGFDIEIATMVAARLGFERADIDWQTVPPQGRETAIAQGDIDYYVAAYTINEERKKHVSFAGPYYVAGQDLLVKKENRDIRGPDDLTGKGVCTVAGSTPYERISRPRYGADVISHDSYAQCVQDLVTGVAEAVTGDDAILKGYAAQNRGRLRVVGKTFSKEPYGVGLARGDGGLRDAISEALTHHMRTGDWRRAYKATLGRSGEPPPRPPEVQRG